MAGLEREVKQLMFYAVNTRDVTGSRREQLRVEAVLESGRRGESDLLGRQCHPRQKSQREMEQSRERSTWSGGTAEKWGSGGMETCQR